MKDWEGIATASGLEIPTLELQKAAKTLQALNALFCPLTANLEVSLEPAAVFLVEDDSDAG